MTVETIFDKFDLITKSPLAVSKLRELVLQLAGNGQLTCSEISDWEQVTLGQLGQWGSGGTPLRTEPRYYGGSIPWLIIGDLNDGIVVEAKTKITADGLSNSSAKLLPPNTLLIAMYGSIGKLGITGMECVTNQAIAHCIPNLNKIRLRYLFYMLMGLRPVLLSMGKGLAQQNISQTILRAWKVGLPSLEEQERIVAKVDELMALCDRLEAQLKVRDEQRTNLIRAALNRFNADPTPENLQILFHPDLYVDPADLRKTILTLAVRGKIVQQIDAEASVAGWLNSRRRTVAQKDNRSSDAPFRINSGWEWLRMEEAFEVAGGIQKTPLRTPRGNAFPYLAVGNVYRGRLNLETVKLFELEDGEIDRRRLKGGDLLIIEGNGSFEEIGRCAEWNDEIENCVHQNHVIRCRPIDRQLSRFVLLFLNSPDGTRIMQKLAITSSGLYSLSVGKIRQILIPLPPLAEQRRIVAKVDELMALVDQLEAHQTAARQAATRLLDAAIAALVEPSFDSKSAESPLPLVGRAT